MSNLVKNLKDLNTTLESLYNNDKQVRIHFADRPNAYSLILKDWRGYDCKVSSFRDNVYTRTNKGVNKERYNSFKTLQTEVKKLIGKNLVANGNIMFSLSDTIDVI
jgi:hypothetical protein